MQISKISSSVVTVTAAISPSGGPDLMPSKPPSVTDGSGDGDKGGGFPIGAVIGGIVGVVVVALLVVLGVIVLKRHRAERERKDQRQRLPQGSTANMIGGVAEDRTASLQRMNNPIARGSGGAVASSSVVPAAGRSESFGKPGGVEMMNPFATPGVNGAIADPFDHQSSNESTGGHHSHGAPTMTGTRTLWYCG